MRPPITAETKDFWEKIHIFNRKYPFWCQTRSEAPRPEHIPPKKGDRNTPYGHFCRVPLNDYACWGFDTEKGRDKFLTVFSGQIWHP